MAEKQPEKQSAEKQSPEKQGADKQQGAEKQAAEKQGAEKQAAEKQATEKQAAEKKEPQDVAISRRADERRGAMLRRELAPMLFDFDPFSTSPFAMMRAMMDDMSRMFDVGRPRAQGNLMANIMAPAIEVFERGDRFVVRADLPGLKKEDVRVEVAGGNLVIEGERREESEVSEGGFYRSERSYGSFRRALPLPEGVNAEDANAKFENGVLEVSFKQAKQAKRIEIG